MEAAGKIPAEWGMVAACKNGPESDISYLSISQKGTDPQSYFFGTPLSVWRRHLARSEHARQ